jgi:ABC-type branched-subunit amino acid transport system substrate-binding protein
MQRSRTRRKVGALVLGVALIAGGTQGISLASGETTVPGTEPAGTEPAGTEPAGTEPTGTDGGGGGEVVRCGYAPSDTTDGDIAGFAGTTPAGELTPEFFDRLCGVDPNLEDLNYAPESYDAVMVVALAVEAAGDDGIAHASLINGITKDGTKCGSFAECKDLIAAGEDIDYDGASGPLEFDGNGEPLIASYGLFKMGDNNRIDPALTEYIQVEGDAAFPEDVPVEGTREGDGVLKVGSLLPQTGSLAFLGPPEFAGVDLAVQEINDAGGVLGQPVEHIVGDSGDTTTNQADQTVDRHLAEGVDAIIGAASSSVTLNVIDKVTAAGITMFSPANTSTELSDYPDAGLYFRTAPPDIYQGDVLGQFVINDGNQTVAIMNLNDSYGNSLAEQATATIENSGGEVVEQVVYDPAAASFDSEVGQIAAADADAIILIGFNESSRILRAMVEQGIGPRDNPIFGSDGNIGNALGVDFDAGN